MTGLNDTNTIKKMPPYQHIDLLLAGAKLNELAKPIAGYVVTFPDSRLDAVMLTTEEATPEKLAELKKISKWPDSIFFRRAWLHSQEVVYGEISNRNYWSLR